MKKNEFHGCASLDSLTHASGSVRAAGKKPSNEDKPMARVVYFRLGRSARPGGEPGAEVIEWASGGWKQKRDEKADPVVLSLDDLVAQPGFVSLAPYIDPVAMGSSYSPHYLAVFR
jgi:hypothetical protein